MDSNNDGIGDIRGIISKLDYLQDLGINVIWLSPAYPSPLADEGYDVSDYYGVDPRFGTLADMDELIHECNKRGIKLLLDLVASHCSDEHAWFKDVIKNGKTSPYYDYFYIVDVPADGTLPTNWRSYFGGSVWSPLVDENTGEGDKNKLYLHSFLKKQPDLNWENPAVRAEIAKNINWWLNRGIAGFRIDAIINIKKAFPFKDYPADAPDGLSNISNMLEEAHGIGEFLTELRQKSFDPHNAFTVGEVFDIDTNHISEWIGENGYFSSMFDFSATIYGAKDGFWHNKEKLTAEAYKSCIFGAMESASKAGAFLSNKLENHDEPRCPNYYLWEGENEGENADKSGITDEGKKMLAGIYFCLRGIPFIYQGQEIGMENTEIIAIGDVHDCSSQGQYYSAIEAGLTNEEAMYHIRRLSRDNARTPMQWDSSAYAGFSKGIPWLPINPNYKKINAAAQLNDKNSIHAFYKQLIALRKNPNYAQALIYGDFTPYLPNQKNLLAYTRTSKERIGKKTLLIAANFQNEPQTMPLTSPIKKILINNYEDIKTAENAISLNPYQLLILKL